jgi:high-affinity nickel-transport protein
VTSLVVAGTAAAVSSRFDSFSRVGGIIGTSVSAAFLIILGLINVYILYRLVREMRRLLHAPAASPCGDGDGDDGTAATQQPFQVHGAGCLFNCFRGLFKLIDRPWKMYPLGVLFGLGFDTSSEVALLGIASIQGSKGTSIWFILIFPVLFTAGMCLLDTVDGALMLALYTSTSFAKDTVAILYYSIVLTGITIVVAVVIGVIQLLSLVLNVAEPTGRFWDGVDQAGEHYDIIGGAICGSFVVLGGLSVLLYRPWRRWMGRRHPGEMPREEEGEVEGRDSVANGLMEGGQWRDEHGEPLERQRTETRVEVGKGVDSPRA